MALAKALRKPVQKLTGLFGTQDVVFIHRESGAFDAETGRRGRPILREDVSAVITEKERHEHDTGSTPGRALGLVALIAAAELAYVPKAEDAIEFPRTCKVPGVWKVTMVETVEETGTAILYKCHIVR